MALNATREKILLNAYVVRLKKGESLQSIDNSFIKLGKINNNDLERMHMLVNNVMKDN